jgi:large subunit ribosomal protein L21
MYAIIRAGGHQEKVAAGEQITIDRRKEDVGTQVTFTPLMVHRDDGSVVSDRSELEQGEATVVATVLQHMKADKIEVFQYRQKTGYRKHTGHRQPLTLVEIAEIRFGGVVETAPEKQAEEPEPVAAADEGEGEKKPAKPKAKAGGAKKAPAKKAPAKKAPAKKK